MMTACDKDKNTHREVAFDGISHGGVVMFKYEQSPLSSNRHRDSAFGSHTSKVMMENIFTKTNPQYSDLI
jgi:hypothetical protein